MKLDPLKFCWLDLGEGKVCERMAGHDDECSPDPGVDFPVASSQRIEELIEQSSLGTPGAEALRARTPPEVVERILAKAAAPSWVCPHCDSPPSYNPNDIAHRYCGHCHHFCDDV